MRAFSTDGYIIDQNAFTDYTYRGMSSDVNGCGWIAAFNLLRAAGCGRPFDVVHAEMNAMFPLQIPGPTPMRKLRRYLSRYIAVCYTAGRRAALAAAEDSAAGILRYWEGRTPHFIFFLRLGDGRFRFLNVSDGQEDIADTMSGFFRGHCRWGYIRTLTI